MCRHTWLRPVIANLFYSQLFYIRPVCLSRRYAEVSTLLCSVSLRIWCLLSQWQPLLAITFPHRARPGSLLVGFHIDPWTSMIHMTSLQACVCAQLRPLYALSVVNPAPRLW